MDIPDIKIECLRCMNSASLLAPAAQKDAKTGEWKLINAKRPKDWIQGPADIGDATKGICPRCAPDWTKLQEAFLTTPPEDESIELRPSFTARAKADRNVRLKPVGTLFDPNIAVPVDSTPRPSAIPSHAEVIRAAPPTPSVASPVAARSNAIRNPNVKVQLTQKVIVAPGPAKATVMVTPPPFASVKANAISSKVEAVKVAAHQGVRVPPPAQAQRISPAANARPNHLPLLTPEARKAAITSTIPKGVAPLPVLSSIPRAVAPAPILTACRGDAQAATPAPSRAYGPGIQPARRPRSRQRQAGIVTTTDPQPIQKEESAFRAVISPPEPIKSE